MSTWQALVQYLTDVAEERKAYPKSFMLSTNDSSSQGTLPASMQFATGVAEDAIKDILESTPYTNNENITKLIRTIFENVLVMYNTPSKLTVEDTQFWGSDSLAGRRLQGSNTIFRLYLDVGKRAKEAGLPEVKSKRVYYQAVLNFKKSPFNPDQATRQQWYDDLCKGIDKVYGDAIQRARQMATAQSK